MRVEVCHFQKPEGSRILVNILVAVDGFCYIVGMLLLFTGSWICEILGAILLGISTITLAAICIRVVRCGWD